MSVWDPTGRLVAEPEVAETEALRWLQGVGNEREWWIYGESLIGHLRVGLTAREQLKIPCGVAVHDAGEAGPERTRRASTPRQPQTG